MSAPARRIFIPQIREIIVKGVPGASAAIEASIDRWTEGEEAESPWESAVFAVCDKIATDLDAQAEKESSS